MTSQAEWLLSEDWAVSRDAYNWCLMRPKGKGWQAVSFYPTPEMLLKRLHEKILRTIPFNPDLLEHLEVAYKVGERLSQRLSEQFHTHLGSALKMTPQTARTILALDNE